VVEKRALAPLSISLIVKRRCALIGLDATEFAAHGLRSAYAAARPPKHSVTLDDATAAAAFGGAAGAWLQKVKLSRTREGQPTHAIGEARLIRAVLSADNSKAMHKKSQRSSLGTASGVNNSLTL
jgi:hypothetical protein